MYKLNFKKKAERFFLTYKTEYAAGRFNSVKGFMKYYNEERIHMGLGNKHPMQIWDSFKNAN